MKNLIVSLFFGLIFISFNCKEINSKEVAFQNGDIIFQTSQSKQCEAVKIATNSNFSHCGIIFIENGKTYVYEAVQPVKMTLLEDWISHGKDAKYVVKRLKNSDKILTNEVLQKMKSYGKSMNNKDYDLYFEWSDNKIYCSELVWKIYKNGANIELCKTKKLKDFNLDNPLVKSIMKERYGNNIPFNEAVVAPSQLYDSEIVETIFDNF
ncbi:YiiX family permuted papain-like enzyme [Flavobacterium cheniae]|uniref:Permuted papain-like amidase YaeF/Yiix C92 family enzyme n=1 Tax=Flavobacterium cheniae TaxID=295428 RepID=A0A562KSE0_9FLAO|nr:YiiX family permuted papain-like enzyme [Flavobacterium cheniae]TDR25639.1 permuted papain-like amidase YaeF/Yiix C92 family enzyme [Flavobacterium cheniae]TWH98175.1 permuted papain-like amidase YaeF/Yiix C92 family enzyme [Flavobacterium cheniae]